MNKLFIIYHEDHNTRYYKYRPFIDYYSWSTRDKAVEYDKIDLDSIWSHEKTYNYRICEVEFK